MARLVRASGAPPCLLIVCTALALSGCAAVNTKVNLTLEGEGMYDEDDGIITACVELNSSPPSPITIIFTIALIGTAGERDIAFENNVENIIFSASDPLSKCINISIIDDDVAEQTLEDFFISLTTINNDVDVPPNAKQISIMDNDLHVILGFENSTYTALESETVQVCVIVLGPLAERSAEFSLPASTGNGTATSGTDFLQSTGTLLNLAAGQHRKCADILILDDSVIETTEWFVVNIDTVEQAAGSAVVFISDNDGATVQLQSTEAMVTEVDSGGTSMVSVCVSLTDVQGGLEREVVVILNTAEGTASGARDYEQLLGRTLTIPPGSGVGSPPGICQALEVIGDDIREDTESFSVIFTMMNSLDTLVGESTVTVNILDNGDVLAECPSLNDPANGSVFVSGLIEGSVADYNCTVGYNLSGPSQRWCDSNGTWNGSQPTCESVDCSSLLNPSNGVVIGNTTFGLEVTYMCDQGYNITGGNETRVCQSNAEWSGTAPECRAVDCGSLLNPNNGVVIGNTTFGSEVTYVCDQGYKISGGNETRVCQSNAEWSGTAPECRAVDCGSLSNPNNGVVIGNTTFGSEVTYVCDQGYTISGNETRMCQSNGEWSGTAPECEGITGGSSSSDDDSEIIGIAVGASVGGIVLIAIVVAVIIVGLVVYRRRTFKKYAAEYRKRVRPYAVYANKKADRDILDIDDDIHRWEMEQLASTDVLTEVPAEDVPQVQITAEDTKDEGTQEDDAKETVHKENLI